MFSTLVDFYAAVRIKPPPGKARCAGVAIQADDTGRVLLLQRDLDPEDPAAGDWEFPGGHLLSGESPRDGAVREFTEETGKQLPPGEWGATWTSRDGIYHGFVYHVKSENDFPLNFAPDEQIE
jgi:8-oxo-dGTP pyrophosphatase MutT (NUDIX family)